MAHFLRHSWNVKPARWGSIIDVRNAVRNYSENHGYRTIVRSPMWERSGSVVNNYGSKPLSAALSAYSQFRGGGVELFGANTADCLSYGSVDFAGGLTKCTFVCEAYPADLSSNDVWFSNWGIYKASQIIVRKSNSTGTAFYVFMATTNEDAGSNYFLTNSSNFVEYKRSRLVIVFDGAATGNENILKVYMNGVQIGGSFTGTMPTAISVPDVNNFYLGDWAISTTITNNYIGIFSDFAIINRALSYSQIADDYANPYTAIQPRSVPVYFFPASGGETTYFMPQFMNHKFIPSFTGGPHGITVST